MNCSASHFQFSILIRSHLIFAVLQAPARGSWNLLFVTHLVTLTPKTFSEIRYAEQHESTRTWAELMAEAQDLMDQVT